MRQLRKLRQRFWAKVDKNGPKQPHMRSRCWIWTGAIGSDGYGRFNVSSEYRSVVAHRVARWLVDGVWPKQLSLHKCDVRACVRRSHQFDGDHQDNTDDMIKKGRFILGRRYRGSKNGRAKLTERDVRTIRRLHGSTTHVKIAKSFGVSDVLISKIIKNEIWGHV